jgi:hypothetical protein
MRKKLENEKVSPFFYLFSPIEREEGIENFT